jgi:diketogulonate reductase-like aldo/keto reductase
MTETGTVPAVNQVELHPRLPQTELRDFNSRHGIATQARSPLAHGQLITDPTVRSGNTELSISLLMGRAERSSVGRPA